VSGVPGGGTSTARAWIDPQGAELLTNGSFETGGFGDVTHGSSVDDVSASLTAETSDVSDGAPCRGGDGGRRTSPNAWFVQLRQEHLQLHRGVTYTLSVWARASNNRVINARIQSSVAPASDVRRP